MHWVFEPPLYLIFFLPFHFSECFLCDSIDVWVQVSHIFTAIHRYRVIPVEGQFLVRIDGYQNYSTVSVDGLILQVKIKQNLDIT